MRNGLLGLAFALLCVPGHAAQQSCNGKVLRFLTSQDGTVMILPDWRQDWIAICNISVMRGGVSPTTCAAWFATIKVAAANQATFTTSTYYREAPACASMPTHNTSPTPGYIMLY